MIAWRRSGYGEAKVPDPEKVVLVSTKLTPFVPTKKFWGAIAGDLLWHDPKNNAPQVPAANWRYWFDRQDLELEALHTTLQSLSELQLLQFEL